MQIYTLQAFFKHAISQPHTGLEQFTVKFGYFPPPPQFPPTKYKEYKRFRQSVIAL